MKKTNNKNNLQVPTRTTQKTFIIAAIMAYVAQAAMAVYYSVSMIFKEQPFGIAPFIIHPVTTAIMPVAVFVLLYLLGDKKATKLWQVCQAAIVAFLAAVVEALLSAINNGVFQNALGYGDSPAGQSAYILQYIPPALTVVLAVVAGLWLRSRRGVASDASPVLQKLFVILLPVAIIGQNLVMFLGFSSGGATDLYLDPGAVVGAILSLSVPAIIFGILYLLIPRQRTVLQRSFTALIYLSIGTFFIMALTSLVFQLGALYASNSYQGSSGMSDSAGLLGLAGFVAVVAWHKVKKLL